MAGLKSTLVRAAIALLIVEGVVSANHASMKYRRTAEADETCGENYLSPCCPDDVGSALPEDQKCMCRCINVVQESGAEKDRYCLAGEGPNEFTLVSLDTDEAGDSVAGGTGSTGHSTRPNGIMSYMMWIGMVFTVIIYANQIAQRH